MAEGGQMEAPLAAVTTTTTITDAVRDMEDSPATAALLLQESNNEISDNTDQHSISSVPVKVKSWKSQTTVKEKDVGIQLTIGKYPKIHGIFKERYADFHVNEIDMDGNIVHLSSFEIPDLDKELTQVPLDDPTLSQWVDNESLSKLQMLQNADDNESKSKSVEFKVSSMDKEARTRLHRWISKFDSLISQTVDKDNEKYILVQHRTKDSSKFIRRPANRARFTHCVLYKEGLDTTDAINFLSRKLRLNPNLIMYAGTKDKRGKTTQRLCISNMDAKRLLDLNRISSQSKLGNFSYLPTRIALGDLKGNHFKILLKDIKCETSATVPLETCIDAAVQSLTTHGFINYFGLQRFGSYNVCTHQIGHKLLQMKWVEVFDLILESKSNDMEFMKKAKAIWLERRDAVAAKKCIPEWHRSIESNLIHGLAKYYQKKDYLSVLNCIPRNMRSLYIHAFQSYIWNQVVTHRLEQYGMAPIVGDLVYADADADDLDPLDISDGLPIDNVSSDNGVTPQPQYRVKREVKSLTTEDVNKYTIFDILMPLDGTDIQYPSNSVKDYIAKLLEESQLSSDYLQVYKHRSDTPSGAYRKMVLLPKNVSHKIITYNENDSLDKLIPSDLDILLKGDNGGTATQEEVIVPASEERPHNKKCLQIEFSLPASAYATMALRELLASDDKAEAEAEVEPIQRETDESGLPQGDALIGCKRQRSQDEDEDSVVDKKSKSTFLPEDEKS